MEGTRRRGGQITTMLAWMKSNDEEYELIKNRARNREEWRHWSLDLPLNRQNIQEEKQ